MEFRERFVCCDKEPACCALPVCTFVAKRKVTVIPHPAYSRDIVPCDLPEIKMALDGWRSNVSMIQAESWDSLTKFQTFALHTMLGYRFCFWLSMFSPKQSALKGTALIRK